MVALRGVNLDIRPGEQVALLGPSGSGKSTLLSLFGGVLRPSAGKVLVDGQDISRISESELGRLRSGTVASLLQGASRNLLPYAGAVENIEFARRAVPAAVRRRLLPATELLERLGLRDLAGRPLAGMSGGERQRIAFAAAVSSGAGLLLADEPTSQLAHDDRDVMLELIHLVNREFGTTVVLVTHDPEVAAADAAQHHDPQRPDRLGGTARLRLRRRRRGRRGAHPRRPRGAVPRGDARAVRDHARRAAAAPGRRGGPGHEDPARRAVGPSRHQRGRAAGDLGGRDRRGARPDVRPGVLASTSSTRGSTAGRRTPPGCPSRSRRSTSCPTTPTPTSPRTRRTLVDEASATVAAQDPGRFWPDGDRLAARPRRHHASTAPRPSRCRSTGARACATWPSWTGAARRRRARCSCRT